MRQPRFILSFALGTALVVAAAAANAAAKEDAGAKFSGPTILLDNGVVGDGQWQVDAGNACDSRLGSIDPNGAIGLSDVLFDYFTYVDTGADGGGVELNETTVTTPVAPLGPDSVQSEGNFAGPNGTINWEATCTIEPGSLIYQVDLAFSSADPFGTVRIINYLDEDASGPGDDVLVLFGTPGADDFLLLTVDDDLDLGVSHGAGFNVASGASYIGWAADQFSDLRTAITGAGTTYSVAGNVDTTDLPPYVDARFPGQTAYGPRDITGAFAFDLDPNATSATVSFSLGGSPDAAPPGPGPEPQPQSPIPASGPWSLAILILVISVMALLVHRRFF